MNEFHTIVSHRRSNIAVLDRELPSLKYFSWDLKLAANMQDTASLLFVFDNQESLYINHVSARLWELTSDRLYMSVAYLYEKLT
jgi:hypothetical protein